MFSRTRFTEEGKNKIRIKKIKEHRESHGSATHDFQGCIESHGTVSHLAPILSR